MPNVNLSALNASISSLVNGSVEDVLMIKPLLPLLLPLLVINLLASGDCAHNGEVNIITMVMLLTCSEGLMVVEMAVVGSVDVLVDDCSAESMFKLLFDCGTGFIECVVVVNSLAFMDVNCNVSSLYAMNTPVHISYSIGQIFPLDDIKLSNQ